jgi:hypothetical protein
MERVLINGRFYLITVNGQVFQEDGTFIGLILPKPVHKRIAELQREGGFKRCV